MEGIYTPSLSVAVSTTAYASTVATIEIPYVQYDKDILITTHVAIFYAETEISEAYTPVIDRFKLLFHGEVTSSRVIRNGLDARYQIYAVDSRSYLNRMPSQFSWYLRTEDVQEFLDDYEFYGLPNGGGESPSKEWYDRSLYQLHNVTPNVEVVPSLRGMYHAYRLPTVIPGGLYGAPRKGHIHRGEDFGFGRAAEEEPIRYSMFCPFDKAKVTAIDSSYGAGGKMITLEEVGGTRKIMMMHLSAYGNVAVGQEISRGKWIGNIGNTGGDYQVHLHIEYYDNNVRKTLMDKSWAAGVTGYKLMPKGEQLITDLFRINMPIETDTLVGKYETLEAYVGGMLDLLATCKGQHLYYRNANKRFKIKEAHTIKDYGNQFSALWGADYYSSFMNRTYINLDKYQYTMLDTIYSGLKDVGYTCIAVPNPKYDAKEKKLHEYIVTVNMIGHKPPAFNYIYVEEEDTISFSGKSMPVTAMKYSVKSEAMGAMITDPVSPGGILGIGSVTQLLPEEDVYGLNRESKDMDFFWRAYLRELEMEQDSQALMQRTLDYMREIKSVGHDRLEINMASFRPDYVVGLPATAYCPLMDGEYDGIIQNIDMYIDVNKGVCQTRVLMGCARYSDDPTREESGRAGITPYSTVDKQIVEGLNNFYLTHFYGQIEEITNEPMYVSLRHIPPGTIPDYATRRSTCTLGQYLEMYGSDMGRYEGFIDIAQLADITEVELGSGAVPACTIEKNVTNELTTSRVSDIYIKERYAIVKEIVGIVKSRRILAINE